MHRTAPLIIAVAVCLSAAISGMAEEKQPIRLFRFEQDQKFGFRDDQKRVVIEPIYDDAGEFACGLAPVNQGAQWDYSYFPSKHDGGKWGYVDSQGKIAIPLKFDWAQPFSDGLAQVYDNKRRRFIDTTGTTVIMLGALTVNAGNFREGLAPVYGDATRYIDKQGKTVFTVAGRAEEFHDGLAVLTVFNGTNSRNSKSGFIDRTGNTVIVPQFAEAFRFSEGLAAVRTKQTTISGKGDTWGYIDKTGKFALKPRYNETHPFRNGIARVHVGGKLAEYDVHSPLDWEGGEWQLIDRHGTVLKRSPEWLQYDDTAEKTID